MNKTHTLYMAASFVISPARLRAYLNWKGVPYQERQAARDIYRSIIVPRIGYPMIPVLITPDNETIQDTTEIIDDFEAQEPTPSDFPAGPKQQLTAHLLELYGARHADHRRLGRGRSPGRRPVLGLYLGDTRIDKDGANPPRLWCGSIRFPASASRL